MKKDRSRPAVKRGDDKKKKTARPSNGTNRLLGIGWGFLAAVLVLAAAVSLRLALGDGDGEDPAPTIDPGPAGSAFGGDGVQTLTTDEGDGGRTVNITGMDCAYTEPEEITFGLLENVDVSGIGTQAAENLRAAGWGEITWSQTEEGMLLLRSVDPPVLGGGDFEEQAAFLDSDKPEAFARTFLENSGMVSLLRDYGISLNTSQVENNDGEIVFTGTSSQPGGTCELRMIFFYTGAFNQATLRATYLAGAVSTDRVVPLRRAVKNAVTWTSGSGETRVTQVELRHIRGLPFYVFTCDDGTVAYALAVEENALDGVPGAAEVYQELLGGGIENNVTVSGLE